MAYNPKEYWNKRGAKYEAPAEKDDELENLKKIVCTVGEQSTKFFEVGSGYGRIWIELSTMHPIPPINYTMCDFVNSMRHNCQQITGHLPDRWDGKTLPYADNQFDFVISFSVLLHVPPCDIENIIQEHVRVCRKNIFIATYAGGLEKLAEHCFEHKYKAIFEKLGLKIVDEKFFQDGLRVNWLLEV